jgi:hypothetical protein
MILADQVLSVETAPQYESFSDHIPITSEFSWITEEPIVEPGPGQRPRKLWSGMDVTRLVKTLSENIGTLQEHVLHIEHIIPCLIEEATSDLAETIQKAIDTAVPNARVSIRSKSGFTRELKELVKGIRQAKRAHRRFRTDYTRIALEAKVKRAKKAIRKFKCTQWAD